MTGESVSLTPLLDILRLDHPHTCPLSAAAPAPAEAPPTQFPAVPLLLSALSKPPP